MEPVCLYYIHASAQKMYGTKHSHRRIRELQFSLHDDSQSIIHLETERIHGQKELLDHIMVTPAYANDNTK